MKQKKVVTSDLKCCSGISLDGQSETTNSSLGSRSPNCDLQMESYEHRAVALTTPSDIGRIYLFIYLFIIRLLHVEHLDKSNKAYDREEINIYKYFTRIT